MAIIIAPASFADRSAPDAIPIVIFNNALVDLQVNVVPSSRQIIRVLPGQSAQVTFHFNQWIEFGMVAHEYYLPAKLRNILITNGWQLQAEGDGTLYLLPEGVKPPAHPLPAQPTGFPLAATRVVDLT